MKKVLALLLAALMTLLAGVPALASGATAAPTTTVTACTEIGREYTPRVANVLRAAWTINQTTLTWGQSFSFNDIVGERTAEAGYEAAENGRGVRVYGGGVAQAASTLYLALMNLPEGCVTFDELSFYGDLYAGSYVESGEEAVLVDFTNEIDFAFTSNTPGQMVIEMWVSEGWLYCSVSVSPAGPGNWFTQADGMPQATLVASAQIFSGLDEDMLANIALAAGSIYDTTLTKNDVFSFNEIVGPRTWEWGYVRALNGRGAEVVGGGVAQVASVLWLCVKELDGFAVIEKATYGDRYNQTYVENSADAIVTDYSADTDFAFRYTGEGSVTIYTWLDGGVLNCEIYRTW